MICCISFQSFDMNNSNDTRGSINLPLRQKFLEQHSNIIPIDRIMLSALSSMRKKQNNRQSRQSYEEQDVIDQQ